jgi:hypothetical protein
MIKSTNLMRKLFILLFLVCFATASAQEADTLFYKRTAFNTPIFIGNQNLSHDELVKLYSFDKKTLRKYKIGRIMLPVAPVVSVAGIVLAVDGLVGVNRTAVIDGKDYNYVERSLPRLLLGLALFVTGGSFMEGSNDFKATAAKKYNEHLKKLNASPKTTFQPKWGITESGDVGFRLEF